MGTAIASKTNFQTVITTGSAQTQSTKEKQLLSKDPAQVTSSTGHQVQDSFVISSPAFEDPSVQLKQMSLQKGAKAAGGFSSLSAEEKSDAKRIMKDLNKNARLFARNEEGALVRITPAYGKERLDKGEAVEVVTQLGKETSNSSQSSSTVNTKRYIFSPNDVRSTNSASSESQVKANYTSSPLTDWDSLLWHDDEENLNGIPGTPTLPPSGESVTLSKSWEKNWSTHSEVHTGIFGRHSDIQQDSGFTKMEQTAK